MKRVLSVWLALMLFAAVSLAPKSACAQYNYSMSSSFLYNQNTYPKINFSHYNYDEDGEDTTARTAKTKPNVRITYLKNTSAASANNNPLPYTRDRALSTKLREEFLADFTKQRTPDSVDEMRAATENTDLVQVIAGFIQLQGLDSGALENLMAFWYGQAWAVANQKPLPTALQYQGIAIQLRISIAKSADWKNMSNEKRQRIFEELSYPLFIQKANYQSYLKAGKKDSMARMASATQEGLKKIGLDLQNLQLSDKGFIR